jgi:hypothetical protein
LRKKLKRSVLVKRSSNIPKKVYGRRERDDLNG